jgi:hypothetical protein
MNNGHALDFDDVNPHSKSHASAVLVPAFWQRLKKLIILGDLITDM